MSWDLALPEQMHPQAGHHRQQPALLTLLKVSFPRIQTPSTAWLRLIVIRF
jgi:hypothetical protein